jgi:signal transduction histidine kinase
MTGLAARSEDSPVSFLNSIGHWLIEPSPLIKNPGERRQARLLAALLIPTIGAYIFGMLFGPYFWSRFVVMMLLITAYILSRTRYRLPATIIAQVALVIPCFTDVAALPEFNTVNVTIPFMWMVPGLILSGLLLPPLWTAVVGACYLFAIAMLELGLPALEPAMVGPVFGMLITTYLLMLLGSILIQQDIQRVGAQAEAMERQNEQMMRTNQALDIAREQALESNRLKSEFLSTMSHELRTPLNAVIGFTEIMMGGMGGKVDEDAMHMVRRVHANSLRLLDLINDILDIARIEAQRVEVHHRPFSPRDLAFNLQREMQGLAEDKGLKFDVIIDPELPPVLVGDETHIRRIITNLLSNAIKFTEAGRVCLEMHRKGIMWEIVVLDSGVGMSPNALTYIFEPFRQIDATPTRTYGGSGLGLAIVQNLARLMDGTVAVKSTLGQGSTFTVTLPIMLIADEQEGQDANQG